jgi:hypothetical protein
MAGSIVVLAVAAPIAGYLRHAGLHRLTRLTGRGLSEESKAVFKANSKILSLTEHARCGRLFACWPQLIAVVVAPA